MKRLLEIHLAKVERGIGICCRPAQNPPLIEIHTVPEWVSPEWMASALIHEDMHIALYRIDPEVSVLFHFVEYHIVDPEIESFAPVMGESRRAMRSNARLSPQPPINNILREGEQFNDDHWEEEAT